MSISTRSAIVTFGAVVLYSLTPASAQVTPTPQPQENVPLDQRLTISRWQLTDINALRRGTIQSFGQEPVSRIGRNVVVQTGPDRRGRQHFDAVQAYVSNMPAGIGQAAPTPAVRIKAADRRTDATSKPLATSSRRIGGHGGVVAIVPGYGYANGGYALYGQVDPTQYHDLLDETFGGGRDAGRQETVFRGELDLYCERMGISPDSCGPVDPYYLGGSGVGSPYSNAPYSVYGDYPRDRSYDHGYNTGQAEGAMIIARKRHVLQTARNAVQQGHVFFDAGRYQQSADSYRLAAASDHGDAASRILAGHAYFAVGRYNEAIRFIRRAFQLQPKIAHLNYDLRKDYGNLDDYAQHLDALRKHAEANPDDYEAWLLLGYILRYSGPESRADSDTALTHAYRIDSRDELVRVLLDVEPDAQH